MSDFYTARFRAQYTPANEEAQPWALTTPGQYLTGEPAREWNAETSTHNLVGSPYGLDVPAGNARLVFDWEVLVKRSSVAKLERYLRRLEIALNTPCSRCRPDEAAVFTPGNSQRTAVDGNAD